MAYNDGTFYTESGVHYIDGVSIINSTIGGVSFLSGAAVPDGTVLAPAGALYVCTGTGIVGLYINEGTAAVPSWKKFGTE